MEQRFGLTDFQSAAWLKVVGWIDSELQRLRESNDSVLHSPEETAVIRGEIKALRRLRGLPTAVSEALVPHPEPVTY